MKLVVLDRDGVINRESDEFIKSPQEFIPLAGSLDAIARLKQAGYMVAIASNQSGVARGLLTLEILEQIHAKLNRLLAERDVSLDGIFFCPHGPDDGCDCRKPKPGLLHQLAAELHVDLHNVPVVGDSLRDLQAAQAVGASPVLVRTGKGERTLAEGGLPEDVPVFASLEEYVNTLLSD